MKKITLSVLRRTELCCIEVTPEDEEALKALNLYDSFFFRPWLKGEDLVEPLRMGLSKLLEDPFDQRHRMTCLLSGLLHLVLANPDATIEP